MGRKEKNIHTKIIQVRFEQLLLNAESKRTLILGEELEMGDGKKGLRVNT